MERTLAVSQETAPIATAIATAKAMATATENTVEIHRTYCARIANCVQKDRRVFLCERCAQLPQLLLGGVLPWRKNSFVVDL